MNEAAEEGSRWSQVGLGHGDDVLKGAAESSYKDKVKTWKQVVVGNLGALERGADNESGGKTAVVVGARSGGSWR